MQTLTHQNLLIEGMVSIHRITDVQMNVTKNKHAQLFIRGIAMDDEELGDITDQLLFPTIGTKFTLYRYEEDKKTPIFSGFIENVNLVEDKGIDYFEVEVISASVLFDRKKRKRSFQNVSMTYEELALQVVSDYDGGATICTVGGDTAIGTPMIQYNETDWEFLKRLASHFDSPIYPEYTHCLPRVWFGFPTQMNMVDISAHNYIYGQDQSYFDIVNNDKDMDFRYIETKTYDNYEIGSGTEFKGRSYSLYQKYGIMDKGELVFTYRFGLNGLKQSPKFYNDAISGMSLLGEVAKDDKEDVYVKLDIDNGGGGTYPYPFRPETGNMMYCMPQVGTKVSLYFPNFDEKNAMVVNCFRTNGGECADTSDPSKRAFNTEHGKALTLHPSTMSLSSTSGSSILFDDDKGITFNSAKNTVFYAMGGIQFNAPNVNFKSPQGEILALKMDTAMEITQSSVSMCNRFDIIGKNGTVLKGTVFVHYEPFDDAPIENKIDWFAIGAAVLGAIVAFAVVAAFSLTGVGALVVAGAVAGAIVGGALTGRSAYSAGYRGGDLIYAIANGAKTGAITGAISGLLFYCISTVGAFVGLKAGLASTMLYGGLTGSGMSAGTQFLYTGEVDLGQVIKDGTISAAFAGVFYIGSNIRVDSGINLYGGKYTSVYYKPNGTGIGYSNTNGNTHIIAGNRSNYIYYTNAQGAIMAPPPNMYPSSSGVPLLSGGSVVFHPGTNAFLPTIYNNMQLSPPTSSNPAALISRKYSDTEIEQIIENMGSSIKNHPLRQAYEEEVLNLKNIADDLRTQNKNATEIAQVLHQTRREIGIKYKDMTPSPLIDFIHYRNINEYGDPLGPTYNDMIRTRTPEQIINSASRPNTNIDKLIPDFREWLRSQ